ncbi:autotransporter outer membrane beta-barrel domain-containing protein, partial [Turicimonas muris]
VIVGGDIDIGYAKLKINDIGQGKVHTNSLGARGYLTWFNQAGTYADLVLTFNHYRHRMSTKMLDEESTSARYSNVGAGVSAEVGHRFKFLEKGPYDHYFIQPQVQLSSYWLKGKNFSLSNGMDVSVKAGTSLSGRVGVDIGKNFLIGDKKPAQVYLRGGVLHEFLGKTKAQLNEFNFEDEALGTRVYYGVGFEVRAKDRVKLYAQLNRESGHRIKTDVQVRFGASFFF